MPPLWMPPHAMFSLSFPSSLFPTWPVGSSGDDSCPALSQAAADRECVLSCRWSSLWGPRSGDSLCRPCQAVRLCCLPTSVASFTHLCHLESLPNLRMEFASLCLDGGLETHPGRRENHKTHLICLFFFSFWIFTSITLNCPLSDGRKPMFILHLTFQLCGYSHCWYSFMVRSRPPLMEPR